MVDIVKIELAGPCKIFIINTIICYNKYPHKNEKQFVMAYLWYIMVSTFQNSWNRNMNNSLIEIIAYIDRHLGFWNPYWRVSKFLTNLIRFITLKTYI